MYKFLMILSFLIRNFYLPNPFESLEYGVLINMALEPLLQPITFGIVGLFYDKGSAPAWGSFLYLFFYSVHTGLLILCGMFDFTIVAIVGAVNLYVTVLFGLIKLGHKLNQRYY
jgi:hypothetical protein